MSSNFKNHNDECCVCNDAESISKAVVVSKGMLGMPDQGY
jgi:hypothetical protein